MHHPIAHGMIVVKRETFGDTTGIGAHFKLYVPNVRFQGGEWVWCHLWLGRGEYSQQTALASIGVPNKAHICNGLELK